MIATAATRRTTIRKQTIRQRRTWAAGRYGSLLPLTGERLAESMDPGAGSSFLDVAAGNENLALAAARRFARFTATDLVASSLMDAGHRSRIEDLPVRFRVADAEALPFADGSFDGVGSTFGAMFARDQERAASELLELVARWNTATDGTLRVPGAHLEAVIRIRQGHRDA